MRVVFMGTPEFAVPSLIALSESHEVVGVFCRPDAVSGRGKGVRPCPVKVAAEQLGLPVFQPATLRSESAHESIVGLKPDLLVVAAYGLILPRAVLEAAALGAVNVHASLLPRWRGAAPIQRAILADDAQVGVSIMRMEEGLDTGPYCLQIPTRIAGAGAVELTDRLAKIGATALLDAVPAIADGSASWTTQDESLVTYAEKISKSDVAIIPQMAVEKASLRIRASLPAAPTRVSIGGRLVTLLSAFPAEALECEPPSSGTIAFAKDGVLLGMDDGTLLVERLKPQGKGEMSAADWSRGVRGLGGARWEQVR